MTYENAASSLAEQQAEMKAKRRLPVWVIYLLPSMLIFILFTIYPFVKTVITSFFATSTTGSLTQFVGLQNYIDLFTDDQFLISLRNTLWYCVLTVPSGVVLALLMAVLLNRQLKGMAIFRTLVFIPVITSMVAVSLVWSMLYEDNSGLLNILQIGRASCRERV